jgi:hypothetical protein
MGKDDFLGGWLQSDAAREDSIALRRIYIDIFDNLVDAVLFAQIMYWHTPAKKGGSRLSVERSGYRWLAKGYGDWQDECRIPEGTARDSIRRMEDLGIIIKQVWHFMGRKVPHLRVDPEQFRILIQAVSDGTIQAVRKERFEDAERKRKNEPSSAPVSVGSQRLPDDPGKRWEPTDTNVGGQQIQTLGANECIRGEPADAYTETTTEITTEITAETTATVALVDSDPGGAEHPVLNAAAAAAAGDDDWETIRPVVDRLLLGADALAELRAQGAVYALAVAWQVLQRKRVDNPGGLALHIMRQGGGPSEEMLRIAEIGLEHGETDFEKADQIARRLEEADFLMSAHALREGVEPIETAPIGPIPRAVPAPLITDPGTLNDAPPGAPVAWPGIWQILLGNFQVRLNKSEYANWFEGSRPVRFADGVLTVYTPKLHAVEVLGKRYAAEIITQLDRLFRQPLGAAKVVFVSDTVTVWVDDEGTLVDPPDDGGAVNALPHEPPTPDAGEESPDTAPEIGAPESGGEPSASPAPVEGDPPIDAPASVGTDEPVLKNDSVSHLEPPAVVSSPPGWDSPQEFWRVVLTNVQSQISPTAWHWFEDSQAERYADGVLTVRMSAAGVNGLSAPMFKRVFDEVLYTLSGKWVILRAFDDVGEVVGVS